MTGFPVSDQRMVLSALREFMPHVVNIERGVVSVVNGDSDIGANEIIASNLRCRIMPITNNSTKRSGFAEGSFDRAEYILTIDYDDQITVGDLVVWESDAETVTIELTSVKYDAATWNGVIRALGVRNE